MGVKITGIHETKLMIERDGDKVQRAALRVVRSEAEVLKELSKSYAPVEKGNLEGAHSVIEDRGGINRRTRVYVNVGGIVDGVNVDRYAEELHEGFYDLGSESVKKAESTGKEVGRKFLERASDERAPEIAKAVQAAVKGAL